MNYKKKLTLLLILLLGACSSNNKEGVVSLSQVEPTETTIITEDIPLEDAQLLIAQCLREKGYDISDPSGEGGLRQELMPLMQKLSQEKRQEIFETLSDCLEENNIPLRGEGDFNDPERQAETLDRNLIIAECMRDKNINISDPSNTTSLFQSLQSLIEDGQYTRQELRSSLESCFDELGIESLRSPRG